MRDGRAPTRRRGDLRSAPRPRTSSSTTPRAVDVRVAAGAIEDFVIVRSDGTATYQLATAVDDALMEITHVIRGEDHLTNTARQLVLYDALGLRPPRFAHTALLVAETAQAVEARGRAVDRRAARRGLPARGAAQLPRRARLPGDRRRPGAARAARAAVRAEVDLARPEPLRPRPPRLAVAAAPEAAQRARARPARRAGARAARGRLAPCADDRAGRGPEGLPHAGRGRGRGRGGARRAAHAAGARRGRRARAASCSPSSAPAGPSRSCRRTRPTSCSTS